MAKSGGAIISHKKFLLQKLKSYGAPINQVGLQPHSPTLSAAYAMSSYAFNTVFSVFIQQAKLNVRS